MINLTWERLDERTVRSRQTIDGARVYIRTMRVGFVVHHGCALGAYTYEDILDATGDTLAEAKDIAVEWANS